MWWLESLPVQRDLIAYGDPVGNEAADELMGTLMNISAKWNDPAFTINGEYVAADMWQRAFDHAERALDSLRTSFSNCFNTTDKFYAGDKVEAYYKGSDSYLLANG